MFGKDPTANAVYGSASGEAAAGEIEFFFGEGASWPTTALFNNCTLCVVRPHAFKDSGDVVDEIQTRPEWRIPGQLGPCLEKIQLQTQSMVAHLEISAMRIWYMDKATAEEFTEVYRGVLPEYHDMVGQLCAGPSLVMEVRQEDAVQSFRKLAGPHDPEVAKHLRPNTLRAKFGIDRVKNGIHATDLAEDGLLEVEYFFNILYDKSA